jgi:uncharacterized repeat protein (TIGR02543 family)
MSVESIGTNIFQNCTALKTVTLSEGLASIGQMAFYNCKKLISLVIPPSVTEVGTSAFTGTGITAPIFINNGAALCYVPATYSASYEVPSDVTSIVGGAFYNCADLTSVTLPGGLTAINGSTFRGCTGLQSITIPENVESIGGNAFFGCAGLQTVTIPGNVSSIGDYAFFSCTNLASVTVPESVTSIGIVAFSSCSDELIIHGASGSYAETYAAEYDIFSRTQRYRPSAVTFSKNDGGPAAESTYYIAAGSSTFYTAVTGGSAHTLAAPARTDYVFGGWYQEAACDNQIMTGAPVLCADTDYTDSSARWTPAEAVTLYAKWLEKRRLAWASIRRRTDHRPYGGHRLRHLRNGCYGGRQRRDGDSEHLVRHLRDCRQKRRLRRQQLRQRGGRVGRARAPRGACRAYGCQ